MANSYVTYIGNGVTTQFSLTFPYLEKSHISVTVDGAATTFTWAGTALVQLSSPPANGTSVRIQRTTSTTAPVVFSNGALLVEEDLNTAVTHLRYLAEEYNDTAGSITGLFGGQTGAGYAVRQLSPSLTTPDLGVGAFTSLHSTASPSYDFNFVTAYPAKAVMYAKPTAASATLPEIGQYVELHSTVGYANRATAYKIGAAGLVIDDSGAAGNSADLYGGNYVVHGYAGAGGNLLTGWEIDVNQLGPDATTLGANNAAYGYVVAIGGYGRGTAAFWNAGIPNPRGWQYGFASSGVVGSTSFYDNSNSPTVLGGTGTHTTGVDFTGMTLTTAFTSTGFSVSGSGAITGTAISLTTNAVQFSGHNALIQSGAYNILYDAGSAGAEAPNLFLGNAGTPSNLYRNASHTFQSRGGGTTFATIDSAGINLGSGFAYKINSVKLIEFSGNYAELYDPAGFNAIQLGNTADKTNYYSNDAHQFYTRSYGAVIASFTSSSVGFNVPVTTSGAYTGNNATAIPAGGAATVGFKATSTANFGVFFGSGVPTLSAAKGSLYLRSDGSSTSTRAYVNTDGATTWTNITTAA